MNTPKVQKRLCSGLGTATWLGRQAAKLRRTRTLKPNTASEAEMNKALHAPASNQQSPHSFGRKVTPSAKAPANGTHTTDAHGSSND